MSMLLPGATLRCIDCDYELDGLAGDGVCPECGLPISASVLGGRLAVAELWYLRRLHLGARLIGWSYFGALAVVTVALQVLTLASVAGYVHLIASIDRVAMALIVVSWLLAAVGVSVGWFLLATMDPWHVDATMAPRSRVWARWTPLLVPGSVFIGAILQHVLTPLLPAGWSVAPPLMGLSGVIAAAHFWVGMDYVSRLALVCGEPELWRRARRRRVWCGLWATVGVLACGLGPVVALVMYLTPLTGLARRLGVILKWRSALAAWTADPAA